MILASTFSMMPDWQNRNNLLFLALDTGVLKKHVRFHRTFASDWLNDDFLIISNPFLKVVRQAAYARTTIHAHYTYNIQVLLFAEWSTIMNGQKQWWISQCWCALVGLRQPIYSSIQWGASNRDGDTSRGLANRRTGYSKADIKYLYVARWIYTTCVH